MERIKNNDAEKIEFLLALPLGLLVGNAAGSNSEHACSKIV